MNRLFIEVQVNILKIQQGMVSYPRLATAKAIASPGHGEEREQCQSQVGVGVRTNTTPGRPE